MDPLTIIASVISLGQAVDRIVILSSTIKPYLVAPEEVRDLVDEVLDLRQVLARLESSTAIFPATELPILLQLLGSCNRLLGQIKELIQTKCLKPVVGGVGGVGEMKVRRASWVRKKAEVVRLLQKLRDAKALLSLQLVASSLSLQRQIAVTVPQIGECAKIFESDRAGIQSALHRIVVEV
ncbi:uncharacterized protein BDZ99DRAFT_273748 [Mytilinidion resinicola]|uniref:Azaphilone pigments biosynthesis cluster protein L N-terminal domain-containing protein n=1 Tax=Mytilinidion resinicola TaxID=574789 RepID=A0A6A6YTT4_9PEZI|nr:uncharacterized protein BDZ99DRAFT_273748 [Mytilinidion resinicola]KAF2811317.1 hypothetical protein BDZ99DRAFT_273748 [Mytilinidion resinicola]